MTVLEQQFAVVQQYYPQASLRQLPSGAALISIPEFPLPPGWSERSTTVKFLAPVGYPLSKPDCFWANQGLRLANGGMPQASNISPIPEVNEHNLWFSWHAGPWNVNRDNLLTYLRVIEARLKEVR